MKQVKFYGPAFNLALAAAGVDNFAELSRELGCGDGYISNAINRNSIAVTVAMQIKQKYGIDCAELKMPEPEEQQKAPEQMAFDLKPGITPADIYAAVYKAIRDAFKDMEKEKKENGESN